MFTRANRLTGADDIRQIVNHGRRRQTVHLRLYQLRRTNSLTTLAGGELVEPPARYAVIVGKKTAKGAVTRNRLKRRLRAALKEAALPAGYDYVCFPRLSALEASFSQLTAELTDHKPATRV